MRILVIILCAALPQAFCASNPGVKPCHVGGIRFGCPSCRICLTDDGNAKDMVDSVLNHFKSHPDFKSRLNPLHVEINKSLGIVTLGSITIPDLGSKLKCSGNAIMTYDKLSNVLVITFQIAADDLEPEVTYEHRIRLPFLHTTNSGRVYGTVGRIVLRAQLHVHNFKTIELVDFTVPTLSNVRIEKITGLSKFYSALVKRILNEWFYKLFVEILRKIIQGHGRTLLQNALKDTTISSLMG